MIDILNRFLIQNRSISIPGLGTLHAERVPARMNADSTALLPPGFNFKFDKYFDAPDKAFFLYLSSQKDIPEYESMRIYNQFAQDFRAAILLEEKSEWPGIGHFRKNSAGEVEFVQTEDDQSGYEPIAWKSWLAPQAENVVVEIPSSENIASHGSITEESLLSPEAKNQVDANSITESPVADLEDSSLTSTPDETLVESDLADEPETAENLTDNYETDNTGKILIKIGWGAVAAAAIVLFIHFSQYGFTLKAAANRESIQISR